METPVFAPILKSVIIYWLKNGVSIFYFLNRKGKIEKSNRPKIKTVQK